MLTVLPVYLCAANIALLAVMGWDKLSAKRHRRRVPEATLLALAAAGGSVGGMLGMLLFRHKTRKPKFYLGFPAISLLQLGLALFILRHSMPG